MGATKRVAVLALTALLGGCAVVPGGQTSVYDLGEERAPPGAAAPHVFVLEKDGATIAVFGTTHLVPANLQWLSPTTERALKSADLILTETSLFRADEVAISDDEAALLAPRSLLPPGHTLWAESDKRLGAAATARIKAALAAQDYRPNKLPFEEMCHRRNTTRSCMERGPDSDRDRNTTRFDMHPDSLATACREVIHYCTNP